MWLVVVAPTSLQTEEVTSPRFVEATNSRSSGHLGARGCLLGCATVLGRLVAHAVLTLDRRFATHLCALQYLACGQSPAFSVERK